MNTLDDPKTFEKLDSQKLSGSIEELPKQCQQVWQDLEDFKFPSEFGNINHIVIAGMGGSALGARIIKTLFYDSLKVPVTIVNDYEIPASIDKKTLLIVSSYSGGTEEPLEFAQKAQERTKMILAICSGGKLAQLAKDNKWPTYQFEPKFNPSNQPRMGLGYSILSQVILLSKLNLIEFLEEDFNDLVKLISDANLKWGKEMSSDKNLAKSVAIELKGRAILVMAGEFLAGNAHTFANQLNENGKNFAVSFQIPELNHHLLEGLKFPESNSDNLVALLIKSRFYHPKNQARFEITRKVMLQNNIKTVEVELSSKDRFLQSFELLVFGSWTSFYLAMENGLDPSPIPFVDYFKAELEKISP